MIICIIGYVVLLFLVLQKQKRKIFVWCEEKTGRQILLILFCANTIALGLFWLDRQEKDSGEIERNVYGGGSRRETYEITIGQTLKEKEVTIDVEEQRYTSQETKKIFKRVMEKMDEVILGENKSLDRVEKDLNLLTEWKDYPVQIQWELDHYEVMNVQGEIQTEKTKAEGTLVELTGKLMYGGEEALYVTNAMVYPESKSKEEKLLSDVLQLVEEKEKTTKTEKVFSLPKKINGQPIHWKKKVEARGYYVLVLGGVSAVLMIALKKQNEQKARKARKEQMLTDYPEIMEKSTHNRRERPVCGHRGRSRGPFYYRITTFGKGPWDARDPHKTTFMALKHVIRLSIWQRQKETPGVEKAPGVSSPQRKESGRSGRDDGELRFGYDPAIHARRLRVYHRPRRLRMASRISIFFAARRFEPLNSMG